MWPTVVAGKKGPAGSRASHGQTLAAAVDLWSTPNVPNGGRVMAAEEIAARGNTKRGKRQVGLHNEVVGWRTPLSADSRGSAGVGKKELPNQVKNWSTPNARDWKGEDIPGRAGAPSLPAQVIRKAGSDGSPPVELNPRFVEALMGFPSGWTNCGVSATPSSRPRRRPRS